MPRSPEHVATDATHAPRSARVSGIHDPPLHRRDVHVIPVPRLVLGAVVALLTTTCTATSAVASTPPEAPGAVTARTVEDGQRGASFEVAWAPSADPDGTVASYVVHVALPGSAPLSELPVTATTAVVGAFARGSIWEVRVLAVDDQGDRSSPSAPVLVAVPRLDADPILGVREGRGSQRSCRGALRACTVEHLDDARLHVTSDRDELLQGTRVELEATWRRPGTTRFVAMHHVRTSLLANGRSVALGTVVRRSGTWCVRTRLVGAEDVSLADAPPTCVRFRPPIELGWAGDVVIGSHYGLPPSGGRDQLRAVHPLLRGPDLMIGNYEGTLSRGGSARCGGGPQCFIFQAPPERARNLQVAGFDVMNLANNHGLDNGTDARHQTVQALARVGIRTAGLPGRVTTVQVEDTAVAIVGFSPYPGTTSMRSPTAIRALVTAARRSGDVVVACFHAGLEGAAGAHVPRGADYGTNTRAALHAAVDAGADVVLGSGPHVVRGIERYRGSYIVYSSGNFAGWHNFGIGGPTAQSGVVRFDFDYRGRTDGGTWDGVVIGQPGIPRPDRSGAVVRRVATLSRADFGRAAARFRSGGRFG